MKTTLLLSTLFVSVSAFAAPKPTVRDAVRDREVKKVELSALKGKQANEIVGALTDRLQQIAKGMVASGDLAAAFNKSPSTRATAERLIRADETLATLDRNAFKPGEWETFSNEIRINVEFLALGNKLSDGTPGVNNPQKAALLKMFEMDIIDMSKEERAVVVKTMEQAVKARNLSSMPGDVALSKVLSLEKLRDLMNCKI